MKDVAIIISGAPDGDNIRDLSVEPGATAGDVLRAVNLTNYLLSREGSGQHFAETEEIYSAIESGAKLRATPVAQVGGGWWSRFIAWLNEEPARRVTVQPRRAAPLRQQAPPPPANGRVRIGADPRPLSAIRGWRQKGKKLFGAFRTPRQSYAGEISLNPGRPSFLIIDPPKEVLNGPHASCFRSRGNGKYHVHFGINVRPENVDAGIAAVERLIIKSLRRTGGNR